ncbi:hypothetical protein QBC35DRAFT_283569 [Podospora australis]|uniref:SSCRP protein n=1 Tax=Podospora australis TaxID=1536484 RepID=A0AAN7AHP7_9PEZI|nr:hypothetical protein QBC35DRAFT_283569 [Podospora australis]
MKVTAAAVLLLSGTASAFSLNWPFLIARGDCHGNNCNRAVTGSRPGLLPVASRSVDCRSFLLTTVTPAPRTTTITVDADPAAAADPTPRAVPRDARGLEARQVTVKPSQIPSWAENCVDAVEFAQGCSCLGVTGSVTTAPTPMVTVTSTLDYCEEL